MTDTSESDTVGYTLLALNIRCPQESQTGSPAFAAMLNTKKCNSSMQLTRAADYAVRVMVCLAQIPRDKRVLLPAIGHATAAPESFLSKVLQGLARAKLINSRRGPAGGFQISARGRKASMREVIEAIDGPINLNICLPEKRSCPRKAWCPAHPVWVKAQEALVNVLDGALIVDLATNAYPSLPMLVERRTGTED